MVRVRRLAAAIAAALALGAGGAQAQGDATSAAGPGTQGDGSFCEQTLRGRVWSRTELYFGRSRSGGPDVTDEEFQEFLDTVVTPRFPDGLTVLDGDGQFRGASGIVVQERAKLLILFYPWTAARNRSVQRIRARYKADFQQEAVLRVDERSCVSF